MRSRLLIFTSLVLAAGCLSDPAGEETPDPERLTAEEARDEIEELALDLVVVRGRVFNAEVSVPLADATVSIGDEATTTDSDGFFELPARRWNDVLVVDAPGFRAERRPIWLFRPVAGALDLGEFELVPDRPDEARLLFGGDVALGRRYLDPEGVADIDEVPEPDPDAMIDTEDPLEDTRAIFRYITPLLSSADWASINLESVVTDSPFTPADGRRFIFFTLPNSLPALTEAGLDHVALANNHTMDYGVQGMNDTLQAVEAAGLAHCGLGQNASEAFEPERLQLAETPFSVFSMTSIETSTIGDPWSATADMAGTADLTDEAMVRSEIADEVAQGRTVISHLHTGYEYTRLPPSDGYTRERMLLSADAGSTLVVSHHPHVAQGFEFYGESLVAHSLGNFTFDQERLETTMGVALEVDFRAGALRAARARGVYIDEFVPGEMSGYPNERFLKRLSRSSLPFGTRVIPDRGVGVIVSADDPSWVFEERSVAVNMVEVEGKSYADLRGLLREGESVSEIRLGASHEVSLGEDLLWFGDMEDHDVDDDLAEASTWFVSGGSSFVCSRPRRGLLALCSTRNAKSESASFISFRNRIRVSGDKQNQPNKDLTALAYIRGENAGTVLMLAEHSASFGGKDFGIEEAARIQAGSYDWTAFWADLNLPPDTVEPPPDKPFDPVARVENARATRVKFEQYAPASGHSLVSIDDVALVSWLPSENIDSLQLKTPHNLDFVRVAGSVDQISVTLRRWGRR